MLHEMLNEHPPCDELTVHPRFLSKECCDLLSKCLAPNQAFRVTIQQILEHEWFKVELQEEEDECSSETSPAASLSIYDYLVDDLDYDDDEDYESYRDQQGQRRLTDTHCRICTELPCMMTLGPLEAQ